MIRKVIGCKPCGSQILVEHLTDNEMMGTSLHLPGKSKSGGEVQQSIILDYGPSFDPKSWGFDKGDRIMVVGSYNPVPNFGEGQVREMGIVEPTNVRGVLLEEAEESCCTKSGGCCCQE
jgi:hypothetical protein